MDILSLKASLWKVRPDAISSYYYPQNLPKSTGHLIQQPSSDYIPLTLANIYGGRYVIAKEKPTRDIVVELIDIETKRQLDVCLQNKLGAENPSDQHNEVNI